MAICGNRMKARHHYRRTHQVTDDFEVTPQVLGEFHAFLPTRTSSPAWANGRASANS